MEWHSLSHFGSGTEDPRSGGTPRELSSFVFVAHAVLKEVILLSGPYTSFPSFYASKGQ